MGAVEEASAEVTGAAEEGSAETRLIMTHPCRVDLVNHLMPVTAGDELQYSQVVSYRRSR